jgi:hypothetical protein
MANGISIGEANLAPSMKTFELESSSPAALLALIEEQPGRYRHLFRGQASSGWPLTPSLYRQRPNIHASTIEESYSFFENQCLARFFDEGHAYLPALQRGFSNDRILAQHFGVPTRLLDWSTDPFVATYFAVEDWQSETDAALFMILPDARYRPEQVRSTGPHKVIALQPPAIDRRIPAQKSVFTFHPYGDPTAPFVPLDLREDMGNSITTTDGLTRGFAKIVIPQKLKRNLYQTLLAFGIDRRNLFPGLEGVGTDIAARAAAGQI